MADPIEVKRVLENASFIEVVEGRKAALTKSVMSKSTTDEDRAQALSDYHALLRLLDDLEIASQS